MFLSAFDGRDGRDESKDFRLGVVDNGKNGCNGCNENGRTLKRTDGERNGGASPEKIGKTGKIGVSRRTTYKNGEILPVFDVPRETFADGRRLKTVKFASSGVGAFLTGRDLSFLIVVGKRAA